MPVRMGWQRVLRLTRMTAFRSDDLAEGGKQVDYRGGGVGAELAVKAGFSTGALADIRCFRS